MMILQQTRGALSSGDQCSLDLPFAETKSLAARIGPTPTFTRASSATFIGSDGLIQTAATNAPRFDHDPLTLACKGLLIEESRTNLALFSNGFNNWAMANSTVAASSVITPEGTADAWKVVEDSLLANHTLSRSFSPVSGTTYTASMWLKSAENGFAFMGLSGGGFSTTFISVNLSTGAVTTALGTPIGATSVAYPNGWWRVSFSLTANASMSSTISIRLSRDGVWGNRSYLGNGVNGMYVYGGQVEAGSFATSYILTVASSVVRSADVCSITAGDFSGFHNPIEGSVFTNTTFNAPTISGFAQRIWELSSTGALNSSRAFRSGITGTIGFRSTAAAVTDVSFDTAAYPPSQQTKQSFGLIGNNFAHYLNNAQVGIDTLCSMPASLNAFYIGSNSPVAGGGGQLNGTIGSLRYYKKRLPNAKLQALTL